MIFSNALFWIFGCLWKLFHYQYRCNNCFLNLIRINYQLLIINTKYCHKCWKFKTFFPLLLSDLVHCTNEPNVSIPQLANLLIERSQNTNWVVVFKALITVHHLMCYGNEVSIFIIYPVITYLMMIIFVYCRYWGGIKLWYLFYIDNKYWTY